MMLANDSLVLPNTNLHHAYRTPIQFVYNFNFIISSITYSVISVFVYKCFFGAFCCSEKRNLLQTLQEWYWYKFYIEINKISKEVSHAHSHSRRHTNTSKLVIFYWTYRKWEKMEAFNNWLLKCVNDIE